MTRTMQTILTFALCAGLLVVLGLAAGAQDSGNASSKATDDGESADDAVDRLKGKARTNPLIEPVREPVRREAPNPLTATDRSLLGTAPGQPAPKLRNEGEFVITRRGRLMPTSDGTSVKFVFEADQKTAQDPPMFLMPCQTRQSMEELVRERGDKIVFIVSGQVFVYRGANYLLPTMMKLAPDGMNIKKK